MKRAFIVTLAIFALLYLGALAVGFNMNAERSTSLTAIKNSWMSKVGGWLESSGPRLELTALGCDGQRADRIITLTEAQGSCTISIPEAGENGPDYRKAAVRVSEGGSIIYVLAQLKKEDFSPQDRDPNCFLEGTLPPGLKLRVKYEPREEQESDTWSCWLRKGSGETAGIVAMKDGGTLTLICEGCCDRCDPSGPKVLRLSLE